MNHASFIVYPIKTITLIVAVSFVALSLTSCQASKPETPINQVTLPSPKKPNIVFIMADDLGYGDLGCLNSQSKIPTPHMDQLARQGMIFTDAHTPSSVCTPTRYGVLTGRYCWRTKLKNGVLWNGYARALIEEDRATVASILQKQGYHTGCIGKWHLGYNWQSTDGSAITAKQHDKVDFTKPVTGGPNDVGFDYSYIIPASLDMDPYLWLENQRAIEPPTVKDPGSKRVWDGGKGFWRKGLRSPSFKFNRVLPTIASKSVAYIDQRAKDGKPFFLYVPFASPHTPWIPNKPFQGKSKAGAYGDFVHETDWAVGQILEALNRNGMDENTLVIMTSDNGSHWPVKQIEKFDHRANDMFRGQKADIWEAGHHVPFICRWPGKIEPNSRNDQTICLTDLTATSAAITGHKLAPNEAEDSYNILPAILDPNMTKPIRPATVHHSLGGMFSIRQGDWKMVLGRGSGGFTSPRSYQPKVGEPLGQLYNLKDDITENENLYAYELQVVEQLTRLLQQYADDGRSTPGQPQANNTPVNIFYKMRKPKTK